MTTRRRVFYSFHYDNDVFRVQQIRNIGALDDDKPVSANEWETIKRGGDKAIEKWIDDSINYCSCVVVLVGKETANSKWVKYEIQKAWEQGKGLVGIYIHNLSCPRTGTCTYGPNPFDQFTFKDGSKLSSVVKCYNPTPSDPYNSIKNNLQTWIEEAIQLRK